MGEVRHALLSAGHAEEQLEQAVHRHEQPRGHRNGRKQQDDALPGEIPGKGEQHAEHASRGADHFLLRAGATLHQQLCQRRGEHAHQVERHQAPASPVRLQRATEHEQREHVEENVDQVAVQEGIAEQLPGSEQRAAERPQRKQSGHEIRGQLLQQEHRDVDEDQGPRGGRQQTEHPPILTGVESLPVLKSAAAEKPDPASARTCSPPRAAAPPARTRGARENVWRGHCPHPHRRS